ncbi:MAG: hypothetical protein HYV15_04240 [Elusimicrobia bacterium]|nr:hypothetical protein [Elusimicrobiota bacterium]
MENLFQRILKAFDSLGLWKDGVELIGSWSFLLYQRHLGVRPMPLRTQDVDFLLPWPYPKERLVDLSTALGELGFRTVTTGTGPMCFVHPELKVELLVPERGKGGLDFRFVKALGVRALPLRFLDMLLKDPIRLKEGGVAVWVPKPLHYCLHKLIVAQRRKVAAKREKDILHAVCVLDILKPSDFEKGLADLPPKWRILVRKSLESAWKILPLERPLLAKFMKEPKG